ncbi:hypothetical protein BGZ49_002811 [Haplosporangium sp. Z 27]|nr:hypothetical protein BGZ49_002811 [Haplosporangium sp. Z 27]
MPNPPEEYSSYQDISQSSSLRKNSNRGLEIRKVVGRRIDEIFTSRSSNMEIEAIEAGRGCDGTAGTKVLTDARKLAKLLKDMMDNIFQSVPGADSSDSKIEMLGMLQSGLRVDFLSLDQVFSRFEWETSYTISSTLQNQGLHTILLLVKELLVFEVRLGRVLDTVQAAMHPSKQDFLDTLFDVEHHTCPTQPRVANPKTLTTPTNSPKRKQEEVLDLPSFIDDLLKRNRKRN